MIHAEDHEGRPVRSLLAVLAGARAGGKLVGADRVLRPEITGAQAIYPREEPRCLFSREGWKPFLFLEGLVQGGADIASHGIVAGHGFVGSLQDDDVLLTSQRLYDSGLRKWTEYVNVERTYLGVPALAQIIDCGF